MGWLVYHPSPAPPNGQSAAGGSPPEMSQNAPVGPGVLWITSRYVTPGRAVSPLDILEPRHVTCSIDRRAALVSRKSGKSGPPQGVVNARMGRSRRRDHFDRGELHRAGGGSSCQQLCAERGPAEGGDGQDQGRHGQDPRLLEELRRRGGEDRHA